jgi:hypothetical protein
VSLREKVRLALIGDGTAPWGENVLEMEGASVADDLPNPVTTGAASALPFVIVKLGPKTPGQVWGNLGDSVEVWPYSPDETWQDLDTLCALVLARLDYHVVTDDDGVSYKLDYSGSPMQDTPVNQWDAYSRPVTFDSTKLNWLQPTHPLAAAFQAWTAGKYVGELQTNPTTWIPSAAEPAVYWRVADLPRVREPIDHLNIWVDVFRASIVGHVLSTDQAAIEDYVGRLARDLPRATIQYAHATGTSYVQAEVARADALADQHQDGQLTVEVRYAAVAPDYQQPGPIRHAEIRDGTQVGVSPTGDLPVTP